jgi:hypothetical protein
MTPDLIVIHEHPEWQKPLFAALERHGLSFAAYDLKRNAFDAARLPRAPARPRESKASLPQDRGSERGLRRDYRRHRRRR